MSRILHGSGTGITSFTDDHADVALSIAGDDNLIELSVTSCLEYGGIRVRSIPLETLWHRQREVST